MPSHVNSKITQENDAHTRQFDFHLKFSAHPAYSLARRKTNFNAFVIIKRAEEAINTACCYVTKGVGWNLNMILDSPSDRLMSHSIVLLVLLWLLSLHYCKLAVSHRRRQCFSLNN